MFKKILLIGGGEIKNQETLSLDKQFIKIAGGKNAIIGFFPTAADDSQEYINTFVDYYLHLGCKKVIPIKLKTMGDKDLEKSLNQLTGIYLGGGSTSLLISTIKKRGIDKLFKTVLNKDIVIAGISAGALASCDYFVDPELEGKILKVTKGLGLQHLVICIVHYNPKRDRKSLKFLNKKFPGYKIIGIEEKNGIFI